LPDKNEYGYTRFTDKTKDILSHFPEKDLVPFSCSDAFYRTDQGVYILEKLKTKYMERRRVKNEKFLDFMRNKEPKLPLGTKFLTARGCKLGSSTLLFYTIGSYDLSLADSLTAQNAIVYSENNSALVDIFTNGIFTGRTLKIAESSGHVRCDQILRATKHKKLIMFCTEEKDYFANYYVYELNLKTAEVKEIEVCTNNFEDGLQTVCK
jgi:hypothetical protein